MSQPLHAMTLPLWGSRLIEASAGTGKTWTIAALTVRLVLGHGGADGFARPLLPGEILVMTFTRAATRELSDRIRSRLLEAAACFRGPAAPQVDDVFLIELLAQFPEGAPRTAAAWRLAMAAQSMDDAAVHTIDAWCQRMLREHAFDSGCLFDEELSANEQTMQREAALDYWRQQVYPLSDEALELALTVWPKVDSLIDESRRLLEQPLPDEAGQGGLADLIQDLTTQRHGAIATLKSGWARRALDMKGWLDKQLAAPNCRFNRSKLQSRHYTSWLDELGAWADDPDLVERPDMKKGAMRLTPAGMQEALRPGESVSLPEHFAAFAALMQALDRLPPLAGRLRLHAAANIGQRLAQLKAQAGSFGFADMLNRLDTALDPMINGDAAARLRARIRAQYPVALIDEFQDTSPLQSRIFDRVYGIAHNDPQTALLLIGDPKQSIYGFRGADIYSYLAARRATAGRQYVLDTNHRSTAALVDAVNQVFARAEGQGEGAFMFRAGEAGLADDTMSAVLGDDPLPFVPVRARGRNDTFVCSNGAAVALQFELDDRLLDVTTSRREFAARCAQRIVGLLNDADAGFQRVTAGEPTFTRLLPADIAVLVRTGKEAATVRRELRRRGVASVYLSDKDSVFDSDEARDLLHWLRAVAAPRDGRLARAALATAMIGLPLHELLRLASDDEAFDTRAEQLRELHKVWQAQGVLGMLRQTLHVFGLPGRWLDPRHATGGSGSGNADGERRLTNFLHLAELLQAASAQVVGDQALIRWLASQRDDASSGGDEQVVRLESDADLVKVVTVHKAKGLEYPLVFLPFPCSFRAVAKARTRFVSLPDANGRRQLHFEPNHEQIAAADKERQREDLRLLYVALTRTRHGVWVGLAALKVGQGKHCLWHRSAIGYALGGGQPCEASALRGQVEALLRSGADIDLRMAEPAERIGRTALVARDTAGVLRITPPYTAAFERHWSIGSFSSMVRTLVASTPWASGAAAARDDEVLEAAEVVPSVPATVTGAGTAAWHAFARGAATGNALHDQLEWLAGEGFALARSPELRQQLLQRCERQGFGAQSPLLLDWLSEVVRTPLPPVGVALDAIARPLPEMEFWLPSAGLPASELDALCRAHLLRGRERSALPPRELRGMLMGFADLVFEHGGRYWVLDYKSNHLGPSDADYSAQALESAMAAHRYDVQAALYLVALHRLLRARLGSAYAPQVQLGGALFLFLRGIRGPVRGCCHVVAPIELLDALDVLLGAAEELAP